jgi:multidrug resistance efflux pump
MSAPTFDSLSFVKRLTEKGAFTQEQAEAATEALQQAFDQYSDARISQFATQQDTQELKLTIKEVERQIKESEMRMEVKMAETKAELVRWVVGVGLLQTTLIAAMFLKLITPT